MLRQRCWFMVGKTTVAASGNGPLDAFCSALKQKVTGDFTLTSYHEHALTGGSSAKAAAYIEIQLPNGQVSWGTGVDTDIIIASIKAVLSSLNRLEKYGQNEQARSRCRRLKKHRRVR